jgi:hypothetical protein
MVEIIIVGNKIKLRVGYKIKEVFFLNKVSFSGNYVQNHAHSYLDGSRYMRNYLQLTGMLFDPGRSISWSQTSIDALIGRGLRVNSSGCKL